MKRVLHALSLSHFYSPSHKVLLSSCTIHTQRFECVSVYHCVGMLCSDQHSTAPCSPFTTLWRRLSHIIHVIPTTRDNVTLETKSWERTLVYGKAHRRWEYAAMLQCNAWHVTSKVWLSTTPLFMIFDHSMWIWIFFIFVTFSVHMIIILFVPANAICNKN